MALCNLQAWAERMIGTDYNPFNTFVESPTRVEPEPQIAKPFDIGSWTKIPNRFFSSGTASKIGPSASLLYLALCENANRPQPPSNTFKASDKALASETGLSPRTIRDARIRLLEYGLVECKREPGQSYTYTLLRQDLKWLKLAERPRQRRKPRAMAAARAILVTNFPPR